MERCCWIAPGNDILDEGFDRIYIGDETCGSFLASGNFTRQVNAAISSGKRVGIILPYLTPERETQLVRLLNHLAQPVDIVVNDAGAFRIVRQSGHTPIIGRLLARQNTDPAILSFYQSHPGRIVYNGMERAVLEHMRPSQSLTAHLTGSPVFSDETAALFLSGCEKMTVMLDLLPHGMPEKIPKHYTVLLNMGSVLVSVLPCRSCAGCPDEEVVLGTTRANAPIYRRKNACYYKPFELIGKSPAIPDYVSGLIWRQSLSHERKDAL